MLGLRQMNAHCNTGLHHFYSPGVMWAKGGRSREVSKHWMLGVDNQGGLLYVRAASSVHCCPELGNGVGREREMEMAHCCDAHLQTDR